MTTTPTQVIDFLTSRRMRLGVSRKAVAFKTGVSLRTLVSWECNERTPYLPHLMAWARALDCELFLMDMGR